MTHKEERIVSLTPELAGKIEVLRRKTDQKNGFQREIHYDRTTSIIKAAKEGQFIPPIYVGELPDKRLILIDGQHRLHAYKMDPFPLKAVIYPESNVRKAAEQFIAINANGVRVSLGFRLSVDPGPDARWMRDLASKYEVKPTVVYNTVVGVTGQSRFNSEGRRASKHAKDLTERILQFWASDKRWNDRAHVYSSVAAMKIVGTIVGESVNPEETMKFLRGLDWTKRSRIGAVIGSSWVFQDKTYKVIVAMMKRAGKIEYLQPKNPKQVATAAKRGLALRTA